MEVSQPFILTSDTFTFDGVPSSITYTLSDSATPAFFVLSGWASNKGILGNAAFWMKTPILSIWIHAGTDLPRLISYYDASGVLQQFTETF